MLFSLKNKVCCITGAGRGIGYELSNALKKSGAFVIGIDLKYPKSNYPIDKKLAFDLTKKNIPKKIYNFINKNFGKLDVLVNCAGKTLPYQGSYPKKLWDETFAVNVRAPFVLTKELAPLLEKSEKSASVINITSINGILAFPDNPAYVSSKSALDGLTRSMSLDLGKKGIRVNSIAPGYITTEMTSKSWLNKNKRRARADKTVLGRWGKPSEIAGPLLFLASDFSSYVTGHTLIVDGGWSIKGL
jgi:gluconate 5-dehydrogenase|tara:strand:- start:804 stop:1538 length:735 start_codon:yes stop_codon:yes gene_type:complete